MASFIPELRMKSPLSSDICVFLDGEPLKTRPRINLITGPGMRITPVDNSTDYWTDITVAATAAENYACFYDKTTQTIASTTTAYPFTYNTQDGHNGITLVDNSKLTVSKAGTYNVQFSVQFSNTDSQDQDVDIWLAKNGSNYADSNSQFTVPSKHGSVNGHLIAALNFYVSLAATEYIELMWCAASTTVSAEYIAPQSTPTRPATPSVIVTMNQVSTLTS